MLGRAAEDGSREVVASVRSATPLFVFEGLKASGLDYRIRVVSRNSLGASQPFLLEGFELKVAENRMGE